jgi:hypothetical protein
MRATVYRCLSVVALVAVSCLSLAGDTAGQELDEQALLEHNRAILEALIVGNDGSLLAANALAQFRVIAPGGLVENKEQAIAGAASFDASAVTIDREVVVHEGSTAVVIARVVIDGVMRPVGRLAPLMSMAVFVWSGDEWRLLSRSLTPCIDRLIEMGRC